MNFCNRPKYTNLADKQPGAIRAVYLIHGSHSLGNLSLGIKYGLTRFHGGPTLVKIATKFNQQLIAAIKRSER